MMPSLMIDHLSINLRSGTDNLVSEISFAIKEGESLILLCREQEESRFVPVRQTPAAFPPVCPSSPVGIGQEELRVSFSELLMHPFSELRPHRGCEAVPHELIQLQYTCLDPFIQAGAFT